MHKVKINLDSTYSKICKILQKRNISYLDLYASCSSHFECLSTHREREYTLIYYGFVVSTLNIFYIFYKINFFNYVKILYCTFLRIFEVSLNVAKILLLFFLLFNNKFKGINFREITRKWKKFLLISLLLKKKVSCQDLHEETYFFIICH